MAKFGADWGDWATVRVSTTHGRSLWKGICMGMDAFKQQLEFIVGSVVWVRFWTDVWCGNNCLAGRYPSLFGLAVEKDVSVADYMLVIGGQVV